MSRCEMAPAKPSRYTHGYDPAVLGGHRRRTAENSAPHLLAHLRPAQRLLDVGSGAGTITADLARLIAPGPLTALEVSREAAELTRAELTRQGVDAEVVVGDVHDLAFPDDSFDVVHAHQVLQHVHDPVIALREMRRVTVPGGIVAARDSDYGGFCWFPENRGLDRWLALYREAARANGGEPDAGRRLLAWAHAAGFEQVEASASTWCYASAEDRAWWAGTWAQRTSGTALGAQLVRQGRAEQSELDEIAEMWYRWAGERDGWFVVPHGEIIARA